MWRSTRGWLGSHGWQLKCQRDISVAREFPLRRLGSKPQAGLPHIQPQSQKGTQITNSYEKQQVYFFQGEVVRDSESFLKGQHTKLCLQWFILGSDRERAKGLEMLEESLGLVVLGRELNEQPPGSLCWVIPHPAEAIFFSQSSLLQMAWTWGEAIAPPAEITLTHVVDLQLGCWLQFRAISLISLLTKANLWELYKTSADPPLGPVLIKDGLGAQSGSFCTQTGTGEGATWCGLLIAPNRASHKQCLTKTYDRVFADLHDT